MQPKRSPSQPPSTASWKPALQFTPHFASPSAMLRAKGEIRAGLSGYFLLAFSDFEGFDSGDAAGFAVAVDDGVVAVKGFSAKLFNDGFFEALQSLHPHFMHII
jgi:hypothetical protein